MLNSRRKSCWTILCAFLNVICQEWVYWENLFHTPRWMSLYSLGNTLWAEIKCETYYEQCRIRRQRNIIFFTFSYKFSCFCPPFFLRFFFASFHFFIIFSEWSYCVIKIFFSLNVKVFSLLGIFFSPIFFITMHIILHTPFYNTT